MAALWLDEIEQKRYRSRLICSLPVSLPVSSSKARQNLKTQCGRDLRKYENPEKSYSDLKVTHNVLEEVNKAGCLR